jgi:hypothetical protein
MCRRAARNDTSYREGCAVALAVPWRLIVVPPGDFGHVDDTGQLGYARPEKRKVVESGAGHDRRAISVPLTPVTKGL